MAMGFLPETDQGTTTGQKKPANRAGLPSEKPDNSQQSAMEVIAKVHQQRLPAADLLQDLLVRQFKTVAPVCGAIPAIPCSRTLMGNRVTITHLCLATSECWTYRRSRRVLLLLVLVERSSHPTCPF